MPTSDPGNRAAGGDSGSQTVLVVGLDAGCFEQLDPLLRNRSLPNLAGLCREGLTADLETTHPPWTPSAWPSVTTGTRPWTHGVYDFYHYGEEEPRPAEEARFVSARDVRVPFLWEILSAHGIASVVVNVPVTHPVHAFDGSLVPGYIAPEGADWLVDGEPTECDRIDEEYRIYPATAGASRLAEYRALVESRAAVAERLVDRGDPSFVMVQFQSTDAVFHAIGDDREAIGRLFETVDAAVGRLLDLAGEGADVLVVSDHGMHRYEGVFHANTWLRDRGDLETATDTPRLTWNDETMRRLGADGGGSSDGRLGQALDLLARVGVTPGRVERLLARAGLDDAVTRLLPESVLLEVVDAADHVDWKRSRAYCRSSAALGIRCNVADREPNGVVPPGEFPALRESLVDGFASVTDPEGRRVFQDVYDRHRVHGAEVANEPSAPDVVLRPAGMRWEVSDVLRERPFGVTNDYNHSFEGLFVARGPRIDADATVAPSVVDVAPTVLRLFGIGKPHWMDGRPLEAAVRDPEIRATPEEVPPRRFPAGRGADEGVDPAVEAQLREMGYL